jgi:RNA 3'-terminal phosphate cyclase (ATP)
LLEIRGASGVANLPRNVATRQRRQVIGRLGRRFPLNDIRILDLPAPSPGTFILLLAEFEHSQACYFALGEKGKPAERVADEACRSIEAFADSEGVIDQYLADQLLLPMAIAEGSSEFRTSQVTQHLLTNAEVIRAFLPVEIDIQGGIGEPGWVKVIP